MIEVEEYGIALATVNTWVQREVMEHVFATRGAVALSVLLRSPQVILER